jgi:hypothetical protein
MIVTQEASVAHVAEALEEATSALGLTLPEVVKLLMAGVQVTDLLDYAEAVASNRLN